jgi:hypothetical protein
VTVTVTLWVVNFLDFDFGHSIAQNLHSGETLSLGAGLVAWATTRTAAQLSTPTAKVSIHAAVPTAGAEVDVIAKAIVGAVGKTVSLPHVQGALVDSEESLRPGKRIGPCSLVAAVSDVKGRVNRCRWRCPRRSKGQDDKNSQSAPWRTHHVMLWGHDGTPGATRTSSNFSAARPGDQHSTYTEP